MIQILEEDDDVVKFIKPEQFTPNKRRAKKLKDPLPPEFLRRSQRQANKTGGFKGKTALEILNPKPLEVIPATPTVAPAPYLNEDVVVGITTGFLQIHPTVVSGELINLDSNVEDNN